MMSLDAEPGANVAGDGGRVVLEDVELQAMQSLLLEGPAGQRVHHRQAVALPAQRGVHDDVEQMAGRMVVEEAHP